MMGGGEYDELYPGLTDEDAAAVQRDAALGTLEVPMTIGSSILHPGRLGWHQRARSREDPHQGNRRRRTRRAATRPVDRDRTLSGSPDVHAEIRVGQARAGIHR
jgi:hypothetical protein